METDSLVTRIRMTGRGTHRDVDLIIDRSTEPRLVSVETSGSGLQAYRAR
jgi:hypothetical protein